MNVSDRFKNKRFLFLLLIIAFNLGCAAKIGKNFTEDKKEGVYFAMSGEAGLDNVFYNVKLGDKIQTTPVHPDDSGFLSGETTTDINEHCKEFHDRCLDYAPKIGWDGSVGTDFLRFNIGVDLRFNTIGKGGDFESGIYVKNPQQSDTRPENEKSFVFTQLIPDSITYVPFIGLEGIVFEKIRLGGELGFPNTGFKVRSGHYRFNRWEKVQEDHWRGFGKSYGGNIGYIINEHFSGSLNVRVETYKPKFAGEDNEIEVHVVNFEGVYEF